jgi:hypothetical protein
MRTTVIVDFDVVGFHQYDDAPERVAFLRNRHRHLFRIRAGYQVTGLDREREIFIEENALRAVLRKLFGNPAEFGPRSCETIAAFLLRAAYARGCRWVEVLEDGRGGARVEADQPERS